MTESQCVTKFVGENPGRSPYPKPTKTHTNPTWRRVETSYILLEPVRRVARSLIGRDDHLVPAAGRGFIIYSPIGRHIHIIAQEIFGDDLPGLEYFLVAYARSWNRSPAIGKAETIIWTLFSIEIQIEDARGTGKSLERNNRSSGREWNSGGMRDRGLLIVQCRFLESILISTKRANDRVDISSNKARIFAIRCRFDFPTFAMSIEKNVSKKRPGSACSRLALE